MAYCRHRGTSKVDPCVALCNTFNSLCFKKASKNCFYEDYVLLRNQLLLLEYDEDDPIVPSKLYEITDMLRRYIEEVPKPIQETVEFVKDVHKKIFFLYGIASRDIRDNRKFPNSQELHLLLVRYVELEYEVLYNADNYSPEYQKQVEKRVLSLLLTILQDSEGWQQRDQLEGNSEEICAMNTLHIMTRVRVEYKKQQNFVENIMYKLLRILNVLDKVSEMKNKNRTFQLDKLLQIPKVQKIFEYLQNRDYGLEDPNVSEDEIEEIVEQAPSPMKDEVAYEVEEEKYDISSFACHDTQKKVMTIDLIDEDFSMVYFRPEVQKLDKKDKKVAFDGYNVQMSERTLSNISDKFDKYIQLNSVTTSSPCDNKPLNSGSAISQDRVFEVDDDSEDSDIEIVQDSPSIVNLVNDSVVSAEEPVAAKQECLLLEKSKSNGDNQHLQPVSSCLELEDALLQCDDISDNEIENEDEILNKYHDAADDVADVCEDVLDVPYVGEDVEDAADVAEDVDPAADVAEDANAVVDVGENANSAVDVGENSNAVADVGENSNSVADVGENSNSVADVGENSNSVADVGENSNSVADVGEDANAPDVCEDANAAADVDESSNAADVGESSNAADVGEDVNATADVDEDLNEVANVSDGTISPPSAVMCDKLDTTVVSEIPTISNEKAHNQDNICSSQVICSDGDYLSLNQEEKKFQTSKTMKVDSDRLLCNSAYEIHSAPSLENQESIVSHKNPPCTSDIKCVVENQKEGNVVPIDTSNLTSNESRPSTDVMPITATNNHVIAETDDGPISQHANKPAEAPSAAEMDAKIFQGDHIKKTSLVGSKVLESSAQTVSVITANSSFTVATEESFINKVTEKIQSSNVQLPPLPSECSTDTVIYSTPEQSVDELIVVPEVNDDQEISANHKASCEDQVFVNTKLQSDIISNIEPEISDVQTPEVCVEEIVVPCIADEEQLEASSNEENKSDQEVTNKDSNIQDQENIINQLGKQPSQDKSLEPSENQSNVKTSKTVIVSETDVITPPSVSYEQQTSEDIEEYAGEFNATFTDHSCSNNLDVLASVAAEQKKMENSNEIARKGNKKKGRKVQSMKIAEKPKKKTKKSELAKNNKEVGVVTRRVTRSSAQLQYTTEVQDQSKCIPSTFMNLENLVTPTPNKIYNLIAETVIENEESLDEPFTCVVSCENQQNSIDDHFSEIVIKNPLFDEDTIEDGISFVCHKKLQSSNNEVVISIPDSEKNFPGINYDILEQAEQFAESNVSSNNGNIKEVHKVLSSNVMGLSEGYYQSTQMDAQSDVLPKDLNVCKNKIWQEVVVESSINVVEEIIENANIVETFEDKEIPISNLTGLPSATGSDPLHPTEMVHSGAEIGNDKAAESGQNNTKILNVTQEIAVNENEVTICATNNNKKLDEVKTGKPLVDEPSSSKITNFPPKKNRRRTPLSTTVALLMPVKKRKYYSKKNIIINKYEKKNIATDEMLNTDMELSGEIKNIDADTSKPQENLIVEQTLNLNQREYVEATEDSVLDYSLSKKREVGSEECLNEVFSTLTTENEAEEVVNHITSVVSAELVINKDKLAAEVCSDANAKKSDINKENLEVNDVSVGERTETEIPQGNKEQSQETAVNSSQMAPVEEEISSSTIQSVVEASVIEISSVEEVNLSTIDSVAQTSELSIEQEIDSTNSKLALEKWDTETPAFAAEEEINSCKTKSATMEVESITETPKLADDNEINATSTELTTINSVAKLPVPEEINSCGTTLTTVDSVVEAPEFTAEEVVNSSKTRSAESLELTVENVCSPSETKSTEVVQLVEEVIHISETKLSDKPEHDLEEVVHISEKKLTEILELPVEEVVHTVETKSTKVPEPIVEELVNSLEVKLTEVSEETEEEVHTPETISTEVQELPVEEEVYTSEAISTEVQEVPVEEVVNSSQSKTTEVLPELAVEEEVYTSEAISTEVQELPVEEVVNSSQSKSTEVQELPVEEVVNSSQSKTTEVLPELPVEEVVSSSQSKSTEVQELSVEEVVNSSQSKSTEVQELPVEEVVSSSQSKSTEVQELPVEEVVSSSQSKSTEVQELSVEEVVNSSQSKVTEVLSELVVEEVYTSEAISTEVQELPVEEVVNSSQSKTTEVLPELPVEEVVSSSQSKSTEVQELSVEEVVNSSQSKSTEVQELPVEEVVSSSQSKSTEVQELPVEEVVSSSQSKSTEVQELSVEEVVNSSQSKVTEVLSELVVEEVYTSEAISTEVQELPVEEVVNSSQYKSTEVLPELAVEEVVHISETKSTEVPEVIVDETSNSLASNLATVDCLNEAPECTTEEEVHSPTAECNTEAPEPTVETTDEIVPSNKTISEIDQSVQFSNSVEPYQLHQPNAADLVLNKDKESAELQINSVNEEVQPCENNEVEQNTEVPNQQILAKEPVHDEFVLAENKTPEVPLESDQICMEGSNISQNPPILEKVSESNEITNKKETSSVGEFENSNDARTMPTLEREISLNQQEAVSKSTEDADNQKETFPDDSYPLLAAYEIEAFTEEVVECCTGDVDSSKLLQSQENINTEKLVEIPKETEAAVEIRKESETTVEIPKESETAVEIPETETAVKIPRETLTAGERPKETEAPMEISKETETVVDIPKETQAVVEIPKEIETLVNNKVTENSTEGSDKKPKKYTSKTAEEPDRKVAKIITKPNMEHRDGNRRVLTKAALKSFQNPYVQLHKLPDNYDYKRALRELAEKPKAAKIADQRSKSQDNTSKTHKRDNRSLSESKHGKRHENPEKSEPSKREKRVVQKERDSRSKRSSTDYTLERDDNKRKDYSREDSYKTKTRSSSQKQRDKEIKLAEKAKVCRSLSESKIDLKSKQNETSAEKKSSPNREKPKVGKELQLFSVEDSKITYYDKRKKTEKESVKHDSCVQHEKKHDDNQTVEPKSSRKEEKSPQSDTNEHISNNKSLIKESNSRSVSRNEKRSLRHARDKTEKEEPETQNTNVIGSTADDANKNKNESSYSTRRHSRRSMSISRSSESAKDDKTKDTGVDLKDSKDRSKKNESDKAHNTSDIGKIKTDKDIESHSSDKNTEVLTDVKKSSDHKRHRSSRSSSKHSIKFENKDLEEIVHEKKKPRVEKNKENVCSPKSEAEGDSKRQSRRKSISVDGIEKNSSSLGPKVVDVALVEPKLSKRERRESLRSSSSREKSKIKSSLTENGSLAESDLTVGRVETCPLVLSEKPKEKLVESKKLPKKRRLSEDYVCELEAKNSKKSTVSGDDPLELTDCKKIADLTMKKAETERQNNESVTNKEIAEGTNIQPKESSKNKDKKVLGKFKSAKKDLVAASNHEAVIDLKDLHIPINREVIETVENCKVEKSKKRSKNVELIQHESFTDVHEIETIAQNKDLNNKASENVNSEVISANDRKAPLVDASNAEIEIRTKTPELKFQDMEDDGCKMVIDSNSSQLAINNCLITTLGEHNETVKEIPDFKENESEAFSCETVTAMKEPTILTKIDSSSDSPNKNHKKLEETSENQQEMVIDTESIKSSDNDVMHISNKRKETILEKLKSKPEGLKCDAKYDEISTNEDAPSDQLQPNKSKSMKHNDHKIAVDENSPMKDGNISHKKSEKVEPKKKDPKRIDFIIENLKNRSSKRKKEVLAPTELVHDNVDGTEKVRASESRNMKLSTLPLELPEKQHEFADVHKEQAIDFSISTTDKNEFVEHIENEPVDQIEKVEEPKDLQQESNANTDLKNSIHEREMETNNCSSDAMIKDVILQTVQEEVAVEDSSQHAIIASSASEIYESVEEAYLVEKEDLSRLAKNAKEPMIASNNLIAIGNKTLEEPAEKTVTDASLVGIQTHEGTEREKFAPAQQSSIEKVSVKSGNSLPSLTFADANNSLREMAIDANALHQSDSESRMVVDNNLAEDDTEIEEIDDEDHLLDIRPRTPEIAKIMNDDSLIEIQHLQTDATFLDKLKVRSIPNHLLHFKETETEKPYSKIENCASVSTMSTVPLKNDVIRDHAVPSTSGHRMNSFAVPGVSQVVVETTSVPLLDVDKQQTEEVIVNLSTSTAETSTSCETTDNLIAVIFSNVALCNNTEVINDSERNQPNKTGFIYFRGTDHNYHSVGDPLLSGKCDNSESDHSSDSSKEVPAPELENVLVDDNILPYIPTLTENNLNQELSESPVDSSTDFQLLEQCLIGNTLGRESSPPLPQGCDNLYQTNLKQEVLDYDDNSASSNIEFSKENSEVYINPFQQQTTMSVENMSELMNAVLTRIQNLNNMTRPTQRYDSASKETLFQPTTAELNVNPEVSHTTNTNSFMMNLESDCNFVPMQEGSSAYPESNVEYSNISFGNEMPETVSFETDFTNFYYLPVTHDTTVNNNCNKKVIVERIPQYSEQQMKYTEINNMVPSVSTISTSTVNNKPITNVNVKPITLEKQPEPIRSSGKAAPASEAATPIKPNNLLDKIKQADSSEPVSTSTAINVGFVRTSSRTRVSAPRPKKPSDRKSVDTRESEESGTETDRSFSHGNKPDNHILKLKVRADLGISNNSIIDSAQGHPAKERSLCIIEDSNGLSASKPSNSRVCIEESKPDVRKSNKQPKEKDALNVDDLNKLSAKTQHKQPKEDALGVEDLNKLNSRKHNSGSSKIQKQSDVINADKPQLVKNQTQTQTQTVEATKQTSCSVKDAKSQTSDLITSSNVTVQNKTVDKLGHSDMIDNVKRRKRKPVDYIERVDYSSIDKLLGYELENGKLPQRIRQKREETGDVSPRPKKRKQEIVEDKQVKLKIPSKPCPDAERTKVDAVSARSTSDAEPDVGQSKSSIFEDSDDDIPKKKKSKPEDRLEPDSMNDLFDRLVKEGNVNTIKNANISKSSKEMDPALIVKESIKNDVQKLNKNTLELPQTSGTRAISTNIFNLEQKKPDAITPVKQIGVVNPIPRSSNVVRKEPPCNRNSYGGGEESRNSSQYYPYYSDRNRRSYPYSNRESSRSSHQGSSRRMEYQPHSSEQRYSSSQRSSSSGRSSRSSRHHSNSRSSTEQRNYNRYASAAANDLAWREDMKKKFPNMFKDEVYF